MKNTMKARKKPAAQPNSAAIWFSRVIWFGIAFNLFLVAFQIFAPDIVNLNVGLSPGFPTIWNRAHGMIGLMLTILYVPVALHPLKYPVYSWLTVVSRLLASLFWAWCLDNDQGRFAPYLYADGAFCIVQAV